MAPIFVEALSPFAASTRWHPEGTKHARTRRRQLHCTHLDRDLNAKKVRKFAAFFTCCRYCPWSPFSANCGKAMWRNCSKIMGGRLDEVFSMVSYKSRRADDANKSSMSSNASLRNKCMHLRLATANTCCDILWRCICSWRSQSTRIPRGRSKASEVAVRLHSHRSQRCNNRLYYPRTGQKGSNRHQKYPEKRTSWEPFWALAQSADTALWHSCSRCCRGLSSHKATPSRNNKKQFSHA